MSGDRHSASWEDNLNRVLRFHEETKHYPGRYARSAGHLDWANQPDPFRSYRGARQIPLPVDVPDPDRDHLALYRRAPGPSAVPDTAAISGMLLLSMGISAWKSFGGSSWALRMNPSSGNLHPTECHVLHPPLGVHPAGVSHYNALQHSLELRGEVPPALWARTVARFGPGFAVCLTGIFWREAWKYGERALRYTQHDAGHALAAVRMAANLYGFRGTVLRDASDDELLQVFGLNQGIEDEIAAEHPDLVLWIGGADDVPSARSFGDALRQEYAALQFVGMPNSLSRDTVRWDRIYETAASLEKPSTVTVAEQKASGARMYGDLTVTTGNRRAAELIRSRRSAQRFDPEGYLSRDTFCSMLDKTLPRSECAPFDADIGGPAVDLLLFVHRVRDLTPGLYCFVRTGNGASDLRRSMRAEFEWQAIADVPHLFRLQEGDAREAAAFLSCGQDIAGDSAFSLGMVARFESELRAAPWRYRHLFWETGMVGQVLYLEAEAHGVRGTGIGCFFDDVVHTVLGITGIAYQSLYHFTVGVPIPDERLTTLPPYHHLVR